MNEDGGIFLFFAATTDFLFHAKTLRSKRRKQFSWRLGV